MFNALRLLLAASLLLMGTAVVPALQTERLLDDTLLHFSAGDPTTSTLTFDGRVAPPPFREQLAEVPAAVVWDIARYDKTLWVATGHEGKLLRQGTQGGALEVVREYEEAGLYAMLARGRELLVGATPSGRVYRLRDEDPKRDRDPIETGQGAIWAMLDTPDGLLVATGPEGRIVLVADDATTTTLLQIPNAKNVLGMAALPGSKDVVVATQGIGMVVRVSPDGSFKVLLDPGQEEVRRVAVMEDGSVLAAVNGMRAPGERLLSRLPAEAAPAPARAAKPEAASYIARIHPDGHAEEWWTAPESPIHDLHALPDGRILVAAGNRGRLFEVAPDGQTNHIGIADQEFLVRLAPDTDPEQVLIGTGSMAALLRLDMSRLGRGEFNSQVFDARATSSWTSMHLVTEAVEPGSMLLTWRTGNTVKPGDGWTPWAEAIQIPRDGVVALGEPVARFFQYRLEFPTEGRSAKNPPRLDRARIFHVLRNRAPKVTEVRVGPPAPKGKPAVPAPSLAGRMNRLPFSAPAELEVQWTGEDPNGDTLIYEVHLQPDGESRWTLLEEELAAPPFMFHPNQVPDGHYRARVVASDRPSIAQPEILTGEAISELFLIDNTAPAITILKVDRRDDESVVVELEVSDGFSLVSGAAWRAGFGEWRQLYPGDGTLDNRTEAFRFEATRGDALPGGFLTIMAIDEAGNTSVTKVPL